MLEYQEIILNAPLFRGIGAEELPALLQVLHDMTLATAAEREQNHSLGSTGGSPAAAYPWKR